jgi:hypothetical protein
MKGENRFSAGKILRIPNDRDWMERQNQPLEVPRRHPDPGRPQFSWGRKNENGIFRNDRDERR